MILKKVLQPSVKQTWHSKTKWPEWTVQNSRPCLYCPYLSCHPRMEESSSTNPGQKKKIEPLHSWVGRVGNTMQHLNFKLLNSKVSQVFHRCRSHPKSHPCKTPVGWSEAIEYIVCVNICYVCICVCSIYVCMYINKKYIINTLIN